MTVVDLLRAHPATINPITIIAFEVEMHAGNRRHGAGRSEHVNPGVPSAPWSRTKGEMSIAISRNHRLIAFACDSYAAMALGKRHHTLWDRDPTANWGNGGPPPPLWERASRTSSDDPPPISNKIAPSASGSINGVQPVAASRASVSRSMTSSVRSSSSATRSRNCIPFCAEGALHSLSTAHG